MSDLAAVVKELRALKEKASPLPWVAGSRYISHSGPSRQHMFACIVNRVGGQEQSRIDAELVELAVNHADLLLKAAEAVLDIASADANNPLTERDMLRIARAALATDEGKDA